MRREKLAVQYLAPSYLDMKVGGARVQYTDFPQPVPPTEPQPSQMSYKALLKTAIKCCTITPNIKGKHRPEGKRLYKRPESKKPPNF